MCNIISLTFFFTPQILQPLHTKASSYHLLVQWYSLCSPTCEDARHSQGRAEAHADSLYSTVVSQCSLNFIQFHLLVQRVHNLCCLCLSLCVSPRALLLLTVVLFACMYIFHLDPVARGSEVAGRHFKGAVRLESGRCNPCESVWGGWRGTRE